MKPRRRRPSGKERGTLIVALMAGIAIVMILSTVAVQNWADVVRRDNEAEMIFRARRHRARAEALSGREGEAPHRAQGADRAGQKRQYFLRHLWKDPLVKGGQWQLVYAAPGGGLYDPSVQQAPPPGLGRAEAPSLGTALGSTPSESGGFPPIGSGAGREGGSGPIPPGCRSPA